VTASRHQFGRFLIGGAVNTGITYAAYLALLPFMEPSAAYTVVYIFGIALSYAINTYFVFQTRSSIQSGLQYPLVYVVQYFIGLTLLSVFTDLGLDSRVAMILVIIASLPVTFLLTRVIIKRPH
jgi:putative flippase GtrA